MSDLIFVIKSSGVSGKLSDDNFEYESTDFLLEEPKDLFQYKNIMSKHLVSVIRVLSLKKKRNIKNIDILFSSPWISKKIESHEYTFKKKTEIDKRLMNKMSSGSDLAAVLVNGYRLENPLGHKVNNLKTISLNIDFEENKISWIKEVLGDYFPEAKINFKSSLFELYKGILKEYKNKDDFLLIDISGEVTEILLVKGDNPILNSNFTYGINRLIRDISKKKNVGGEIIASLMRHYDSVIYDPIIDSILLEHKKIIVSKIKEIVSDIPKNIFLCTKSELSKVYINIFDTGFHSSRIVGVDILNVIS